MGGSLAFDAAWLFAAFILVLVLAAGFLATRRYLLERGGGTVECGLRATPAAAWRLGLAAYKPDQLYWFTAFGLRLRPDEAFDRRSLSVLARRPAAPAEVVSIGAGTVVVQCQTEPDDAVPAPRVVDLAMSEEALTGFLAWLESSPPGHVSGLS